MKNGIQIQGLTKRYRRVKQETLSTKRTVIFITNNPSEIR